MIETVFQKLVGTKPSRASYWGLASLLIAFATTTTPAAAELVVTVDHLANTPVYDGGGGTDWELGQTFLAQGHDFAGVRVQFSSLTNPVVNELSGPADLVLYAADDLLNPVELSRETFLNSGESVSTLETVLFTNPVSTVIGQRYFFSIDAVDLFGIGLHSYSASTYSGGSEAFLTKSTSTISEASSGRDLSFQVFSTAIPEPGSAFLFAAAVVGLACRRRRFT